MERLMDFDVDSSSCLKEREHLHVLLGKFGLKDEDIEKRSYRSMILER